MAADYLAPCHGTAFCRYMNGCAECRPGTWREPLNRDLKYDHHGSLGGVSYELARKSVRQLAAELRAAADKLDAAYDEGFRLYDIEDDGTIRLAKGRVSR